MFQKNAPTEAAELNCNVFLQMRVPVRAKWQNRNRTVKHYIIRKYMYKLNYTIYIFLKTSDMAATYINIASQSCKAHNYWVLQRLERCESVGEMVNSEDIRWALPEKVSGNASPRPE